MNVHLPRWSLIPRALFVLFCAVSPRSHAQVSIGTAVDLALRNSPRVKIAQADVAKAVASLSEAKDVFIPSLTAGAGIGQSYGYSFNPPTLFTFNGQSLVYNGSQFDYIRSGHAGLVAARQALQDTRESVAEDAALAFAAIEYGQQREAVLGQQSDFARRLTSIVQDRLDAGRDSKIDLTTAKLAAAQLRLALLRAQNQTAIDREHLARLLNLPASSLRIEGTLPSLPAIEEPTAAPDAYMNFAVASAYSNALAKRELAWGDARALHRPQLAFVVQYNRYATFTDSFKTLESTNKIGANEGVFGVQVTLPIYDRHLRDKSRESAADADHALHEAEYAQFNALDGRAKLRHSLAELEARAEVARLEQQLSQQQLDILTVQLQNASSGPGPQMTPKDEQNARIAERDKYLNLLEASYQLRQAQINLLRQSDQLEVWIRTSVLALPSTSSTPDSH